MAAKEEKAVDVAALEKKVDGLCAQVRRMQDNWVKFSEKFIGRPVDGKKQGEVGSMRIGAMVAIAVIGVAVIAFGAGEIENWSQGTGTATLDQTGRTGNITLTIDAVSSANGTSVNSGNSTTALSTVTLSESGLGIARQTTITLDDVPITIAYGGSVTNKSSGGTKIMDFPEGRILIHGVTVDSFTMATNTTGLEAADGGDFAFGTAVASGATITGTEVDLCPSTSIDPITNITSSALSASAQFDGTSTAKDMYVNVIIDAGDLGASTTGVVDSATIKVTWSQLGDY